MKKTQHFVKNYLTDYHQSKSLKDLNFSKKSLFYYGIINGDKRILSSFKLKGLEVEEEIGVMLGIGECYAYTAEDLIDFLPKRLDFKDNSEASLIITKNEWAGNPKSVICYYEKHNRLMTDKIYESSGITAVQAIAELTIKLLKHRQRMRPAYL